MKTRAQNKRQQEQDHSADLEMDTIVQDDVASADATFPAALPPPEAGMDREAAVA